MLAGGCLCGRVRYEAAGGVFSRSVCHCRTCQQAHGAPMVGWFSVKHAELMLQADAGALGEYRSSDHAVRRFCTTCGTPLFFDDSRYPDDLDIATASLDDPEAAPPEKHIWTRSQLVWVRLADGLPRYPKSSSADG